MRGVAADICAEGYGVQAVFQKRCIRAVGVIHKQRNAVDFADLRDGFYIGEVAEVVGAGDVDSVDSAL